MDAPCVPKSRIFETIERAAAQAGLTEFELTALLAAGMDVPDLLEYVEGKLLHAVE